MSTVREIKAAVDHVFSQRRNAIPVSAVKGLKATPASLR